MKQPTSNIYLGTSSWKYDSWKGLIYDPNKTYKPNDYLPDYAKHFNTVEIDQWFWSLFPTGVKLSDPETVKIYSESIPDDFIFSIKVPNSITLTNYYARQPVKHKDIANQPNNYFLSLDLFKRFLELIHPMGKNLGPIIFQFEYLNRQKMASLKQFLDKLSDFFSNAPEDFDYAIEIRNPNYLNKDYSDFLKQFNISTVLIEGYYMPPVSEVVNKIDISTGESLILRLQGADRQGIEKLTGKKWDKVVSPQDDSLQSVAQIVNKSSKHGKRVIVNVNNHYEGCAVLTIEKLREMMGSR